jgi:DNA (cytosine-5)-methyltransferase 1
VRLLDLFSGIGGFSLAAQWVWGDELEIVGFCEIEKYAQKVLQKNFPGVPIYEDIKKLNGKDFKNIDLITGGFPCQDISVAGKGAGLEGARSSLWFEMHRIIREIRPRFALIENVPMLTIRGGTRVIADLAEIGYDAEWTIIGADDVGAWHRRKRIWIVAYPRYLCGGDDEPGDVGLCGGKQIETTIGTASQLEITGSSEESEIVSNTDNARNRTSGSGIDKNRQKKNERRKGQSQFESGGYGKDVPDTKQGDVQTGCERQRSICEVGEGERISSDVTSSREDIPDTKSKRGKRRKAREQRLDSQRKARLSGRHDTGTIPDTDSNRFQNTLERQDKVRQSNSRDKQKKNRRTDYWAVEPNVGRVAHGIPNRVDRLKGLGNAIVPQVAALIMEKIKDEIKQCGIGEIGEGVTPRHKYKYVGSYDINIDGIGGDYWECTECGNIKFDEPDNI